MPSKGFKPTTVMSDALVATETITLLGLGSANVATPAADAYVTVQWVDASEGDAVTRLILNQLVTEGDHRPPNVFPLVLDAGDKVQIRASADNAIECSLTWSRGDI